MRTPTRAGQWRAVRATAAAVVAAGVAFVGLGPATSAASSHREAPLVAADPAVDNTDLYAFVSPERAGYVTFIANWQPFEEPNGGPNFYPFATDAVYNINVDSDGDARADAVFRWTFQNVDKRGGNTFLYANGPVTSLDDENLLFRQTYTLESSFHGEPFKTRVKDAPVAPSRVGKATMPDYGKLRNDANKRLPGGWNVYAGQADDPFYLDLRVFDLLYGGDLSETGQDTLAGYNVNTIALQVPFSDVALKGDAKRNPVIGVWTTTERARTRVTGQTSPVTGDKVQVSRLGNPLVNEVVVPASLKDAFNSIDPSKDADIPAVVARVTDPELPKLIEAIYKIPAPATPRNDLVEIFLTGITTKANGPIKADLNSQLNNADVDPSKFRPSEMLRLNLSVPVTAQPNRLGVLAGDLQGFPNGRRLTDDVVDISIQAVEGAAQTGKLVDALATGDKVDANDNAFGAEFPYLALPNSDAVNKGGGTGGGAPAPAASASAQAANPQTTPSAFESGTGMTAVAVGTSALAAGLGTLMFIGWWRRRNAAGL
ncbi:DUF4331 domain-containing protein [Dactylosporangium sp. AC04546]|uniref:DUF4331 domain-containing protein n=1 Tax=Dactylosporangium sp. AC04546 TaxID=2862460 RepID=UPI001EE14EC2|nr:DUF4331 domain-containing protein [Dactylosporangium sp. AC04546]WVK80271.1 DUF4331 domain-containing protein [Dactylosporangium sp. AC04546]